MGEQAVRELAEAMIRIYGASLAQEMAKQHCQERARLGNDDGKLKWHNVDAFITKLLSHAKHGGELP